jgi:hypothetical protein
LTLDELSWLTVGERLAKGDLLYADLWERIPPLSGLVYGGLFTLFGASKTGLLFAGNLVFILQNILLVQAMSRREILHEKNYVPTFFFSLFCSFSSECFVLSPQMLAQTALLPAFRIVINGDKNSNDFELLKIGFWASISALFDSMMFFSLLWFLFAASNFRGMSLRHFSLLSYGFFLPFLTFFLFYFQQNKENYLVFNYIIPMSESIFQLRWNNIEFLLLILLVFLPLFTAFFKILIQRTLTSYQGSVFFILIFWVFWTGILMLSVDYQKTAALMYWAFPASFMLTKWIRYIRKKVWAEIAFLSVSALLMSVFFIQKINPIKDVLDFEPPKAVQTEFKGKNMLVLGKNRHFYFNNHAVTPFLDWQITQKYWGKSDNYETLTELVHIILQAKPDVIVDEEGYFEKLIIRVPVLAEMYQRKDNNIFVLK